MLINEFTTREELIKTLKELLVTYTTSDHINKSEFPSLLSDFDNLIKHNILKNG